MATFRNGGNCDAFNQLRKKGARKKCRAAGCTWDRITRAEWRAERKAAGLKKKKRRPPGTCVPPTNELTRDAGADDRCTSFRKKKGCRRNGCTWLGGGAGGCVADQ